MMTLLYIALSWPLLGIAAYWIAILLFWKTGIAYPIAAHRDIRTQAIGGWMLFIDIMLALPILLHIRDRIFCVAETKDGKSKGVVVSGWPAGADQGYMKVRIVPGATSYKDAHKKKSHNYVDYGLNEVTLCDRRCSPLIPK